MKTVSPRRAILIGASAWKNPKALARVMEQLDPDPRDLRVGVDGGVTNWRRLGLAPHFGVGDWDSLADRRHLRGIAYLSLPTRKSHSDLHYACRTAVELGATELVCLGVTGGRPDHQLATLFDLSEASERLKGVTRIRAIDERAEYVFLSTRHPMWRRKLPAGQLVSVFALAGIAQGVTLGGLEYPLKNARLTPSSLGLSNVATGGWVEVTLRSGRLVVMTGILL